MEPSRRKSLPNGRSDESGTTTPPTTRAPSTRVKQLVNYDDKTHYVDLKEDIDHGVAHVAPVAHPGRSLIELDDPVKDQQSESWETESLFEDILGDITEDRFFADEPLILTSLFHPHDALKCQVSYCESESRCHS